MTILKVFKVFFAKHPIITNSVVYGSLCVGAEFSQQVITRKILAKPPENIDKSTLGRFAIMGVFIYSPVLYTWYKWLDKTLPGTTKQIIVKKLLLDQFLLTPPLLAVFFTAMSLMERANDPFEECKEKFLTTFARSCLFWIPAQTVNFIFVSPKFRVMYVGSCAFAWVNILCWVKRQNYTTAAAAVPINTTATTTTTTTTVENVKEN